MKNKEKTLGLLLISHFLLSLIESCIIFALGALLKNSAVIKIFSLVFTPVRFLLPLFLYSKATGYTPFVTPLNQPRSPENRISAKKSVFLYVFALSLTVTALNTVGSLTNALLSLFGQSMASSAPVSVFDTVYMFIKSVCLAAILEETLFRGALLHAFSERKAGTRILLSALLFALMHGNAFQFFYAFAAGAVIAAFAVKTRSLIFSVSVHFGANLITFIFSLLNVRLSPESYKTVSLVAFLGFAVISVFSAILYFCKFRKEKNDTPADSQETGLPREILVYIIAAALLSIINIF